MNEQGTGRVTNADSAFVSNVKYAITFRREFTREGGRVLNNVLLEK